jgi:AcrR family transcriptional regulator
MALSHFLKLKPEKQELILRAALDEFSEYGYDLASTNRIVERAGIAKGTLFKYFSSKEDLFVYLCDTFLEVVKAELELPEETIQQGLFEYLKYAALRKAALKYRYPKEYALVAHLVSHSTHPVYHKILANFTEKGMKIYEQLIQNVNTANLRPGVTAQEAFQLVGWTLRGMEEYIVQKLTGMDYNDEFEKIIFDEFDRACELLKYGLYNPAPEVAASQWAVERKTLIY